MSSKDQIKSAIFVGEWENTLKLVNEVIFSNDGQILWGCRKNRYGNELLRAIDVFNGTEVDFKLPSLDIEFIFDYLPFTEKSGILIGCESHNGVRLILMEISNNFLYSTGVDYNITNLGTVCNLPKLQRIASNLITIQITKIDIITATNMTPSLYILQIPFEKNGKMLLKHQLELIYSNQTDELCLFNNKLYYFAEKKKFNRVVEVELEGGESKMHKIGDIPITVEHLNSKDLSTIFHKAKFYVLAFPQLSIFDLNLWSWSNIELLKYSHMPHMIQPSLSCITSNGNLKVHFAKHASKHRLQTYIYQIEQPESLQTLTLIQCKRSRLTNKLVERRSILENSSPQSDTSNYVEKFRLFSS